MIPATAARRILRIQLGCVVALGLLLSVRAWVVDWYRIPTGSMFPTIQPGDVVVVRRRSWIWRALGSLPSRETRGRIVALRLDSEAVPMVKRIAAIAGDSVIAGSHGALVNGIPHVTHCPDSVGRPGTGAGDRVDAQPLIHTEVEMDVRIAARQVFLLGDNLAASRDSRGIGPVPASSIIGDVKLVIRKGRMMKVC